MPRPIFFAARSGRFVNPGTDYIKIVDKTETDLVYRIHNTSRTDVLNIKLASATTPPTHELVAGGSIDLLVNKGDSLLVGPGKGVYDSLRNAGMVRSGSFRSQGEVKIAILGNNDYLYRLINSSDLTGSDIEILKNGTTTGITIAPESSLDVGLTGIISVRKAIATSMLAIEGVFDLIAEF